MSTTFVTCIFQLDNQILEIWLKSKLKCVFCVFPHMINELIKHYPDCTFEPILTTYEKEKILPTNRNEEKDTIQHIWNGHQKVRCTYLCSQKNPFKTNYFVYMDFDACKLFRNSNTWQYLRTTYNNNHLYFPDNKIHIAGCFGPMDNNTEQYNDVNWRFCGSFFVASKESISEFNSLYDRYFHSFTKDKITWEVNFWAWLEFRGWKPNWYKADHSDSMVYAPHIHGYSIIKDKLDITYPHYIHLSPYFPMSAAYIFYNNQHFLNTRYVNYWIYPNGAYYFPDNENVIRTYNVQSKIELVPYKINDYNVVKYKNLKVTNTNVFSEDIEDIRLYVSQENKECRFIGSTLSYSNCDRIRMIEGKYDPETHSCSDFRVIIPPIDSWCEKNWAPIPLPTGEDGFIYSWNPFQIGKIVKNKNNSILEIIIEKEMDFSFKNMKGSTSFIPFNDNLIGLVHFSKEHSPRQYFHKLVVLDKKSFDILYYSETFCFLKESIEFCVGMCIIDDFFGFWISQMDRDPLFVKIRIKDILLKNI